MATVLLNCLTDALGDKLFKQPLEAGTMSPIDWDDLATKCSQDSSNSILIRASKPMLSTHSTYFRSLFSNFREAESGQVTVIWDLHFVCAFLRSIYTGQLDITPCNLSSFLEGAVYFGADEFLDRCKLWAASEISAEAKLPGLVENLPLLWSTASTLGIVCISELCLQYTSINFEEVASSAWLRSLPFSLLCSCIDNPLLTVSSEVILCNALFDWCNIHQSSDYAQELLSRVRSSLLPANFLHGLPEPRPFGSASLHHIRLTKYSKVVDLTDCQQITDETLFESIGSVSQHAMPPLNKDKEVFRSHATIAAVSIYKNIRQLLLGRCWRLTEDRLLPWLRLTCRDLQVIKLPHCPQISVDFLLSLGSSCPFIEAADLSMDINFLETIQHSTTETTISFSSHLPSQALCFLVELSLEGRNEVTDSKLRLISEICPSILAINLNGCRYLTDVGIGLFLSTHRFLNSLHSACTAFGVQSCASVLSEHWGGCILHILVLDHCLGLSESNLIDLLSRAANVKLLSLGNTKLTDDGLYSFSGACLEHLNVQNTRVTGAAICYVLRRNERLKVLNFKDCRNALSSLTDQDLAVFGKELVELRAGWGSDRFILKDGPLCTSLRSLAVGIGSTIDHREIPSRFPFVEHLSLVLQDIDEHTLKDVLVRLQSLSTLELKHSLHPLSRDIFDDGFITGTGANLKVLKLEGVCPLLSNSGLVSVAKACKNLHHFSLTGARKLSSESLNTVVRNWPALAELKLEDCDGVTAKGASSLLNLRSLQKLVLRHNGSGLERSFISQAARELPLLRCLSLDLCDAVTGFDTPPEGGWRCIATITIARCTWVKSAFCFNDTRKKIHKHTILLERDRYSLRTSTTAERLCPFQSF